MSTEMMLGAAVLVVLVLLLATVAVVFYLVAKLPKNAAFMDALTKAAYEVDKFTDDMENQGKRSLLASQLVQVLGWRRIFIPSAVIMWLLGLLVLAVRWIQKETGCPDLHQEEVTTNASNNAAGHPDNG